MQLTVLGKSPAWQDAGGACSGYLVEGGGACVLLDCGSGVFGKLRAVRDYADVDAVLLSHLHADHVLDLIPYASALTYGPHRQKTPRLFAPPGAREKFRRLCAAASMREEHIERAFAYEEYDPAAGVEINGLQCRFQPVPHYLPTNAIEFAANGARITYSADSSPSDDLCSFAYRTDLLLIEATLPQPESEGPRGHLTPGEAGQHGQRARARRLVITHMSDELDADWVRAEAEKTFGGPVDLAHEGAVYRLDG